MINGKVNIITAPTEEPVTLAEAMEACRADSNLENTVLLLISAGREAVEKYINRSVMFQTLEVAYDGLPSTIELPRPPLIEIESLKVFDTDNAEYSMSIDEFIVYNYGLTTILTLKSSASYPTIAPREINSLVVKYTAGYNTANVPVGIKQAIMLYVTWHIDNPSGVSGNIDEFNRAFYGLIDKYKVIPLEG